jgi:hypothetical protein
MIEIAKGITQERHGSRIASRFRMIPWIAIATTLEITNPEAKPAFPISGISAKLDAS